MRPEKLIRETIDMARMNVEHDGGPFAAIIVKENVIISKATNTVTKDNDPTAHAEINAIRTAARTLKTHDLSDCTLYSSCEPCPMCLAACYWARINTIYYANSKERAKEAGFDDSKIYSEITKSTDCRNINMIHIEDVTADVPFTTWKNYEDRKEY
jgi:guanine deaminase